MFNFFGNHRLPPTDQIIAILASFVIATTIHECMHAYVAWRLGDDTGRRLGRITLNPVEHFDPIGFFGMVLISLGYNMIGWGKPVPVNPGALRWHQRGMAIVAAAGPASNIVQAAVVGIPLRIAEHQGVDFGRAALYLHAFVFVNLLLAAFNMIPIPPLDGHKMLMGVLPNFWYPILAPLEQWGFLVLLLVIFVGGSAGANTFNAMYAPVYNLLSRIILGSGFPL